MPTPVVLSNRAAAPRLSRTARRSLVALAVTQCLATAAYADCIVTTLADDGTPGTLRACVETGGLVTFDEGVSGTIALLGQIQHLSGDVTIQGPVDANGKPGVTIDGGGNTGLFYVQSGSLTLDSLVLQNGNGKYAGAVECYLGGVEIRNSTISSNTGGLGGAINGETCDIRLESSTLTGNQGAPLDDPRGAAYFVLPPPFANVISGSDSNLDIINSTISGNNGQGAAVITLDDGYLDNVTIINSTISGNSSTALTSAAIASQRATWTVYNSIIANNGADSEWLDYNDIEEQPDPSTFIGSNNYLGDSSFPGFTASTGVLNLGALADNGGPTQTMALGEGSAAINAGSNARVPAGVTTDQRGTGFARVSATTVDIGAFEFQSATPPVSCEGFFAPVDRSPTVNKANAGRVIPLKWRCTKDGVPVETRPENFSVTVQTFNCSSGVTQDAIEEYAPGNSGLTYHGNGTWHFNWATPKNYANSCKTASVNFDDATISADFRFVR